MDRSNQQSTVAENRSINDLLRIFFCRKLLNENLLSATDLYPPDNVERERQVETPLPENIESPLELNGTQTPNVEPSSSIQRLLNHHHSNALSIQLENSIMAPKSSWNAGVYSPIEVYIDSPSAIDNSGQVSTLLSSISTDDLSPDADLFEIDVLERINRLRRQGKWSLTRLPLCLDAPRPKTHFDYFLEECMLMQTDFLMERETKQLAAKMLAYEAKHYVQQKQRCSVIDLRSNRTRRQVQKEPHSTNELLSNLPSNYIADLKSRIPSGNLFDQFRNSALERWELIEKLCNKIAESKPTNILEPKNINSKLRTFAGLLRPYQKVALEWFIDAYDNSFGCILSDDEKLGKKIQVLAFFAYLEENRRINGPHLIVTDETASWSTALERFLPNAKVLDFSDQKDKTLHDYNICLVDFETYFSDDFASTFGDSFFQVQVIDKIEQLEVLKDKSFDYIFDENALHGDYRFRILLGNFDSLKKVFGTPKFISILLMLLQILFPQTFQKLFEKSLIEKDIDKLSSDKLISHLQSFELSRKRDQVKSQILASSLEVCKCRMISMQRRIYEKLIKLPEIQQKLKSNRPIQALDLLRKCCSNALLNELQVELPINVSLYYPILRRFILDFERDSFCKQLCREDSFADAIKWLQTSSLRLMNETPESLLCPSTSTASKFQICLNRIIAYSPFLFEGNFDCSLRTIWHHKRFKQLANELFLKRSSREDEIIASSCLRLPDRSRIILNSGKFQELFKQLTEIRRLQQRCIIFTAYQSTQNLLCETLSHHNFTYMTLADDMDRKEFLDTFNKNRRIGCVLASTKNSLYRLNLNKIGAVFVLETDWENDQNSSIKRFFNKFIQGSGAKFSNLVTENSLELQTNLFDTDVKSNLLEISQSVLNDSNKKINKPASKEQTDNQAPVTEFTLPYAPICCDLDGVESISDTLSSSGYEGSLDDANSILGEPITYDREFFESDSYLNSIFKQHSRNNPNKFVFTEETQIYDSFCNSWYTGEIIEPDEIEYTRMSPTEQQLDEDTLFDFNDDQENNYIDSRALSPKSTDDFLDLGTAPASVEASRISTEFTLDPAIQLQAQRSLGDQDQESRLAMKRSAQRIQSRSDELRKKMLETQAIVLSDPEPTFRPDGKGGYIPPKRNGEWIDTDTPSWTFVEDHALLDLIVKQLRAVPIPSYISRSFCLNWDLIAFGLKKFSFHDRSASQCCTRFRELINKKFNAIENPSGVIEQFNDIDLSVLNDERVIASAQQPSTRYFNKTVSTLARKIEDSKRVRNAWQSRTNWLSKCDEDEKFNILSKVTSPSVPEANNAFNTTRLRRVMNVEKKSPSETLTPNKKPLPQDVVMVHHQYSRALRLSRVMTTAKSFLNKALKKPTIYYPISGYSTSISYFDRQIFIADDEAWKMQMMTSAFNYHSHLVPKIHRPLESRLLWVDYEALKRLNDNQELRIEQLLQSNLMQYTVDIRSNMLSSRKLIFEVIQIASKYIRPKLPKKPLRMSKTKWHTDFNVDSDLLEDVKRTIKANGGVHRILRNGNSLLPIGLESFAQNEKHFYSPILPTIPQSFHIFDSSILAVLSLFSTNNKLNEKLQNSVQSIATLTEDLLFECQDKLMNQQEENPHIQRPQKLFLKPKHTNLIIKFENRRTNKKALSNNKFVITCLPDDHFELRSINMNEANPTLNESIKAHDRILENMKRIANEIQSTNQKHQILTPNSRTNFNESNELLFSSTACSPHSSRLQRQQIQQYACESLPKHSRSISFQQKPFNFDYSIRPSFKFGQRKRQKRRGIQFENKFDDLPSISCIESSDKQQQSKFLVSHSSAKKSNGNTTEFLIDADNSSITDGIICLKTPSSKPTKQRDIQIDSKLIHEFVGLIQKDEDCINIDNFKLINHIYKLSQNKACYSKADDRNGSKLPHPTIDELGKIREFIKDRFNQIDEEKLSSSTKTKNVLEKLIDEHYSTIASRFKQKKTKNDEKSTTIALKLQLINSTPQFFQILPNDPSKFQINYNANERLLDLQYQTDVQKDLLTATSLNGRKVQFEVENRTLPSIDVANFYENKPVQRPICRPLEKPFIRQKLLESLSKMSSLKRSNFLNSLKHRYLRLKHLQHKQEALKSIDKMEKTIDQVLNENGELLEDSNETTVLERKKAAIQRLLTSSSTKFPSVLNHQFEEEEDNNNLNEIEESLNLVDLLVQTTTKTQVNLCEKLHPTFILDKSNVLEINYDEVDKTLVAFDKSLERFFEKLNSPSSKVSNKPIESNEDIYEELIGHSSVGPSKIIKYRPPNEPKILHESFESYVQQIPIDPYDNQPTSAHSLYPIDHAQSTPATPQTNQHMQHSDPNRERSLPAIPSAMQIPVSAYHLQSESQVMSSNQTMKSSMEPIYYTKRSYTGVGGNPPIQRLSMAHTSTVDSSQYSNSGPQFENTIKRDMRVLTKTTPPNRPVVRHVVVGNRPKFSSESDSNERNIVVQREDSGQFETRYYQTAPGQRELTVREKLQQDMARGYVQTTTQKKMYPVRMPTTMKRRISENQQPYGGDSFDPNQQSAPKRSRPAQYMYQVKGPASTSGGSFQPTTQQSIRSTQISSNASISNTGEQQQSTSQTVPVIYHHGYQEPIKTYIRRENHQFAIHEPQTSSNQSSPKTSSQLKVYERRALPTTTGSEFQATSQTSLSKAGNEMMSEKSSKPT